MSDEDFDREDPATSYAKDHEVGLTKEALDWIERRQKAWEEVQKEKDRQLQLKLE